MNTENLSPAQTKAIEAGGTNNVIVGNSLVKRGIMVKQADMSRAIIELRFILSPEFNTAENEVLVGVGTLEGAESLDADALAARATRIEKQYADAIAAEEAEADKDAPTVEAAMMKIQDAADQDAEIEMLRGEYALADEDRAEEIRVRLAQLGTVVYPEGTPQYQAYREELHEALKDPNAFAFLGMEPKSMLIELPSAKIPFTQYATLGELADAVTAHTPAVKVRDPKETRYAHVDRWTDENLEVKYAILHRRLGRKTLLKADRMQAERHCQTVENELLARGIRPGQS